MKIYADVRCLQDPNYSFRGVGAHASMLLRHRGDYFPGAELIGLTDPSLPELPGCHRSLLDSVLPWSKANNFELGSIFIELSPMTHDLATCNRLLDRDGVLTAAAVYDFIPLDQPERYLADGNVLRGYLCGLLWLEAFDLYSCISESTRLRLLDQIEVDPSNVSVSGVSLRPPFEEAYDSFVRRGEAAGIAGDAEPYFLFVGGADERKNATVVLAAHADLSCRGFKTKLIIVGKYPGGFRDAMQTQYLAAGGRADSLRFSSELSDAELVALYRGASASVVSSYMEGFSLPVIEAAACGSPVLVSDIDAHRELIDNPAARFQPADHTTLASLMQRVLEDRGFVASLMKAATPMPARFRASEVADRFWRPIRQAWDQRRQTNSSIAGYHAAGKLPSLAILSPFPPTKSGVADYTQRTCAALSGLATVDVFTETENPAPSAGVNRFHRLTDWAYWSDAYDRVLTVVGNSPFHARIIELQKAHGGPCLVHDNRLADLYYSWKGPEYFLRMASRCVGRAVSHEEGYSWLMDPSQLPGIFFDELIDCSDPLIVHSRGVQKQVLKQYGVECSYLPFSCYRTFDESELTPQSRAAARGRLQIRPGSLLVISLGAVIPSKAPERCIEAIGSLRRAGIDAELHFVGESEHFRKGLETLAAELGIGSSVRFCDGWISDETYRDYVTAADLGVQLRTHFFGGLSGALMDCIASGLPVVANNDLAEAMDSPDYVFAVDDRLAAEDVSDALLRAYHSGLHAERLTDARTNYVVEHSFENYARHLLEVLKLEGHGGRANPQAASTLQTSRSDKPEAASFRSGAFA